MIPKLPLPLTSAGKATMGAALLAFLMLWRLDRAPALWWDEGWTLTVARTWVERGFYGRLLDGQLAPPGLEGAITITAPVALSLRLFGMGAWQGRLPAVVYTLLALVLIWYFASLFYNRAVAAGALFAAAFLSNNPAVNTLLNGRQVLADIPVVCFLLAGYACLLRAWQRSPGWILAANLCWALAFMTKLQALPFWTVSLAIPMLLALRARQWKPFALLLVSLPGAWLLSRLLLQGQALLLSGHTAPAIPLAGLNEAVVFVPALAARSVALVVLFVCGLPALFGLAHAARGLLRDRQPLLSNDALTSVRLMLLLLSGSWFGWYTLLSNGAPRYLASPNALASIFVGAMLYEATGRYDIPGTVRRATDALKLRAIRAANLSALGIALLVVAMCATTVIVYAILFFAQADPLAETAAFLNTQTAPDARIEAYDAELFFLLQRRYHYPPDQLHIELIRRQALGASYAIAYDPLASDPDYLVVGPINAGWHAYDQVLAGGSLRLLQEFGPYQVYARVR